MGEVGNPLHHVVLVIDVDGVVRAKLACDRHARGVMFATSDDDACGAGLLGGDHAGEAELAGTEDNHGIADADLGFAVNPADAVGDGEVKRRNLGWDTVGDLVNERLRVEVHDSLKPPQRPVRSSEVKPYIFSIICHRTGSSGRQAILAVAAGAILEHDGGRHLDVPPARGLGADALDAADDLVALDDRRLEPVGP